MKQSVKLSEIMMTENLNKDRLHQIGLILGVQEATDKKGEIFMPHAIRNRVLELRVPVEKPFDRTLCTLNPIVVKGNSCGSAYNINEEGNFIEKGRKNGQAIGKMRRVCACGRAGCYVRSYPPFNGGICKTNYEVDEYRSLPMFFSRSLIPDHHQKLKLNFEDRTITGHKRSGAGNNPNKPLIFRRQVDNRIRVKDEVTGKTVRVAPTGMKKFDWPPLSAVLKFHKTTGLYWAWASKSEAANYEVVFDRPFNMTEGGL